MKRLCIAACLATTLALAGAARAEVDEGKGAFIAGKVLPPGISATVAAEPVVATKFPTTAAAAADGSYRIEVKPGFYRVVASAPGYAYESEEPPQAAKVSVAYAQTATVNFDLVPAATLSGRISRAGESAVVVAMRRSSLPRSQRFTVWGHVEKESGDYTIPNLRPGVYDLLIIAPERGILDGRGWMLGKPSALSPADQQALLDLNTQYAQSRLRRDYTKMLALLSKQFSDTAGNTYDKMAEQAAQLDPSRPSVVVLDRFTWQSLLMQGDADDAMGIVSQVTQVRHRGVKTTLEAERQDFLVTYRKENGAWCIYRMEAIRSYRDLAARITRLTGHICALPPGYIVTYSGDPHLGGIELASGQQSPVHDFTFPPERNR